MTAHPSISKTTLKTFETLEDRFKEKWKDECSYEKSVFKNTRTPIIVTCRIHGDFKTTPNNHLKFKGCTKCRYEKFVKTTTSTLSEIREEVIQLYKNKSITVENVVKHSKSKARSIITCNCVSHGKFIKNLANHKKTPDCPTCAKLEQLKSRQLKRAKIAEKRYNYNFLYFTDTKDYYKTVTDKISMYCKKHDVNFTASFHVHLRGETGCPFCTPPGGFNYDKPGTLYYLSINKGQAYKIGITNRTVNMRFRHKDLKSIEVICTVDFENGRDAFKKEQQILKEYKMYKYLGPDLLESGNTELFSTNLLDINTNLLVEEVCHQMER